MIRTYTATESTSTLTPRDLWRNVNGKLELVAVRRDEDGYGTPDPKRYQLILSGISDEFEEDGQYGPQTKVICEFEIVGSKKWSGTKFSGFYTVPQSWTDDRARLGQLAGALNGRKLQKGDEIDFGKHILAKTRFEGVVTIETSARGNEYAKIDVHLPLDTDDDDAFPEQ